MIYTTPVSGKIGDAIGPPPFQDSNGKLYVYKVDGNSIGHGGDCNNGIEPLVPVPIMLQELEDDGATSAGDPVQILDACTLWESTSP